MTPDSALQRVTRATRHRANAADEYRRAIVGARLAGASYGQIARAAGTGAPNVIRIIRRNTPKGDDQT
jgi:hypothetical protein